MIPNSSNGYIPKSDNEIIEELQAMGIQVIYKPVALIPQIFETSIHSDYRSMELIEVDIHEAYRKLTFRNSLNRDPFSD